MVESPSRIAENARRPKVRPAPPPPLFVKAPRAWKLSAALTRLYEAAGGCCHYCGVACTMDGLAELAPTRDHRIPLSRGGADHVSNKVLACSGCNQAKGARTDVEFWAHLGRGVA